jgi:hypothetical protein
LSVPLHIIIKLRCSGFYKNDGTREFNYGNCIAASRPDHITPGILWIGRSTDKNGVYTTTQLIPGVEVLSIKNDGNREINYGNCIASSHPVRITPGTLWIGRSNDKNGVYSTTNLLPGVDMVSIKK